MILLVLMLMFGPCEVDGEQGIEMYDGTCMTPSLYDETFGAEALAEVPSLAIPEQSVAEVYNLQSAPVASQRLIGVGLVEEPFTFVEFINKIYAN